MNRFICRLLLLAGLLSAGATLGPVNTVSAQQHRLVPLDHWAYEYVQRLQRRGLLLELHPTALPYTVGEIASAVRTEGRRRTSTAERRWLDALRRAFADRAGRRRGNRVIVGGALQPGVSTSTSDRLDPLRPARSDDASLSAGSLRLFPNAAGRLFFEAGPVVAQAGLRFDLYYRDDPDGLEAANRLISRNEDAYAGINTRFASAHLGRIQHHWASFGDTGLLVSRNPVAFDQVYMRLGGRRLSLRSVVGELDSMTKDGRFTGTAGSDSVDASVRRFVSTHRLDWRPSRRLALTFMESSVISGPSTGFSLKFLNPLLLHAFGVDGRPKNDENNGLLAGMLWGQLGRWTLQGQLLVDDFDVLNETGEPPSLAATGHLGYASPGGFDAGASFTAVAARTYNAHQPDGRYTHLLRGMGAPYNDYVQAGVYATLYAAPGGLDVAVTPRVDVLFQGESSIHMPYPSNHDEVAAILDGTVQRIVRPAVEIQVHGTPTWWLNVDGGPAFITNEGNVSSNDRTAFTLTASFVLRLSAAGWMGRGG